MQMLLFLSKGRLSATIAWASCMWAAFMLKVEWDCMNILLKVQRDLIDQRLQEMEPPKSMLQTTATTTQYQSSLPTTRTTALFHEDTVLIEGRPITYRIPTKRLPPTFPTKTDRKDSKTQDVPPRRKNLVIGVLSNSKTQRDYIRKTWAKRFYSETPDKQSGQEEWNHDNSTTVLFLVGGNLFEISEEFRHHQDLLWVNFTEAYEDIVYKVLVFMGAANRHFPDHHLLKTDDDSYVRISPLSRALQQDRLGPYCGLCEAGDRHVFRPDDPKLTEETSKWTVQTDVYSENHYPLYAQGAGYLVSPQHLTCMVRAAQVLPVIPVEDGNTGILARTCRTTCFDGPVQTSSGVLGSKRDPKTLIFHHVQSDWGEMGELYRVFGYGTK